MEQGIRTLTCEADILARTCWGEQRSLGKDAMHAVANVVLNRVAANRPKEWGATITDVCQKPQQFDCWNSNDPNYPKLLAVNDTDPQFSVALQIARDACNGCLPDITNGGAFYYNTTIPEPYWARGHIPCHTIGSMIIYNDIQ